MMQNRGLAMSAQSLLRQKYAEGNLLRLADVAVLATVGRYPT